MAISTDKQSIISEIQPLLPPGKIIEAVCQISSELTVGKVAGELTRRAATSGFLSGALSRIGLGGISSEVTQSARDVDGTARVTHYYLVATPEELILFTAYPDRAPGEPWTINYSSINAISSFADGPKTVIIFDMKSGKTFRYSGEDQPSITETAQTIQNHLGNQLNQIN